MSESTCGCCVGLSDRDAPVIVANLPALDELRYRIGTHGSFLAAMIARLTTHALAGGSRPLAGLRTREPADPAIALLDAWALIGDVLTFYQERIANEGYLRTATERRSLLELGRLVGYQLRPAVAATAHLAFTLAHDPQGDAHVMVPAGTRAQSVPGPGEQPQAFETAEAVDARESLTVVRPRLLRPQNITIQSAQKMSVLRVEGTASDIKPGDRILFDFGDSAGQQVVRIVTDVTTDPPPVATPPTGEEPPPSLQPPPVRTTIAFQPPPASPLARESDSVASTGGGSNGGGGAGGEPASALPLDELVKELQRPPSVPPRNAALLRRDPETLFGGFTDLTPQLLSALRPRLGDALYASLRTANFTARSPLRRIVAMQRAAPFGASAPKYVPPPVNGTFSPPQEWNIDGDHAPPPEPEPAPPGRVATLSAGFLAGPHASKIVSLDREYPNVLDGDWAVLEDAPTSTAGPLITRIGHVIRTGVSAYLISGTVTKLELAASWLNDDPKTSPLDRIRGVTIHLPLRTLRPAPVPDESPVEGDRIDLDGVYQGLASGRSVIVAGERADLPGNQGVSDGELTMIAAVEQTVDTLLPGDVVHTVITLAASGLAFAYRRATTKIYANVVKATQGETVSQVLGGGDPAQSLQSFALSRKPLTYLAAPNALGAVSTLELRVDDLLWQEAAGLARLGPTERAYLLRTAEDDTTRVVFGTGTRGARLPSGVDNVRARYRAGAGAGGNLASSRITQLVTRPPGVSGVSNPLASTGGADRDTPLSARENIPVSVEALERLVSVRDFEDFARARAGIGKASAAWLTDGRRRFVHLTIAGVHDAPVAPNSDLFAALRDAISACGDPHLPFELSVRVLGLIVVVADVAIDDDRDWPVVEQAARSALLDAFSADRRQLGQDVLLSDVIGTLQGVPGVRWVQVPGLTLAAENMPPDRLAKLATELAGPVPTRLAVQLARVVKRRAGPRVEPAQLAVLSPAIPDTLILRQVTS